MTVPRSSRRGGLSFAAGVLLLGLLPGQAGAQEEVPTFRTERVYFTCAGNIKLQNYALLNGEFPGWSTAQPGSAALGNGCGMYENNQNMQGLNLEFKGTFTGNLDNLTVELYDVYASQSRPDHILRMRAQLFVDEEMLAETEAMDFATVDSGATQKLTYTFTELNYDDELGDGTQVHQVHVVARSSGQDTQSAWVWGAAEVPAGLTFNPPTPEAKTIPVNRTG